LKKFGKLVNRNGRKYHGEFKNNVYDGKGKLVIPEKKTAFEGIFKCG
jgi:hypothetical protein